MELASALAGEAWSDHPATVQPALAAVARVVNDRVSEQDLARLEALVPDMIGTATEGIDCYARLVLLCATAALSSDRVRHHPDIRADVESARRMARCALAAVSGRNGGAGCGASLLLARLLASSPMARRWYRRVAVWQAALSASALAGPGRSDQIALCDLLEACVLTLRHESSVAVTAPMP